jgi:hypothetical protein
MKGITKRRFTVIWLAIFFLFYLPIGLEPKNREFRTPGTRCRPEGEGEILPPSSTM